MSDGWLEHSVQVEVDAPMELVWNLWSDLEQMPRWMKWIDSVQIRPDKSRNIPLEIGKWRVPI